MNLNQLRVFHAVASLRSFTRAAEELFLTQPGISKHIRQLEEFYGIRLFDRLGRQVVPTQAGEVLFESTQSIFEIIEDSQMRIEDLKGMTGGRITIGASFTAGTYILPGVMGRFRQKYPDVEISLEISLSHEIAEKVISNDFDIGFIGAPYEDDRLLTTKLREEKLVVIIPKDHAWKNRKTIRFANLADQPFVLSRRGSGTRAVIEKEIEKAGIEIKRRIEFGNTEAVKKAVAAGVGISILSESVVETELKLGRIRAVSLSDRALKRAFHFTVRRDRYRTNATRALIRLLEA